MTFTSANATNWPTWGGNFLSTLHPDLLLTIWANYPEVCQNIHQNLDITFLNSLILKHASPHAMTQATGSSFFTQAMALATANTASTALPELLAFMTSRLGQNRANTLVQKVGHLLTLEQQYTLHETYLYGSSRLGVKNQNTILSTRVASVQNGSLTPIGNAILNTDSVFSGTAAVYGLPKAPTARIFNRTWGLKQYELSNHLGNVQVTISDKKLGVVGANQEDFIAYEPEVKSATDYYAYGSVMPRKSFNEKQYRYGFNSGSEMDNELSGGIGNHYTTEWRELDTRLGGRWWSSDRIVKPWESPYAGFSNNPIYFTDPSGLDPDKPISNPQHGDKYGKMTYDGELKAWVLEAITVVAEIGSNVVKGTAIPAALLWNDGAIRNNYYLPMVNDFKQFYQAGKLSDGTYSMLRYQAQKATKMQLSIMGQHISETPPFGKPLAQQKALAEGVANGTTQMPKGAMSTRGKTTKIATAAQVGGKMLVAAGAIMSIHHIITANDKRMAISQEAGGYVGAWAGAEGGAAAGAAIGLWFGGLGAAPGALIGGFIGGIGGYFGGYEAGGAIYEETKE